MFETQAKVKPNTENIKDSKLGGGQAYDPSKAALTIRFRHNLLHNVRTDFPGL
jgi:hypothetical protein